MATLRKELRKKRVLNYDRRYFIPEGSLDTCIDEQIVGTILAACDLPVWKIPAIQAAILNGGKKTFAILVLIKQEGDILRFIEHDDFQNHALDSRLPFSLELLSRVVPQAAEEFLEEHDETVLPFTSVRPLGRGGFGQVQEVTLPWHHQNYFKNPGNNVIGVRLAKKELDVENQPPSHPADSWNAIGASEHEVLSLLHHLKHPNVLELLASYTHRGKHNLLFPVAKGGDLQSFLAGVDRPEELRCDSTIYAALAGLGSALATLHDFRSTSFDMELMGYHHDLKPKNILVSGAQFILSDFGLSKLEARDDSKTEFKIGRGHYLAPECEDLLDHFKKGTITRASDVWSFGCILLEVVIYMRYGTNGVHQFRDDRRYEVSNFVTRTFFVGANLNPAVVSWTAKLFDEDVVTKRVVHLIYETLRILPQERPRAKEVTISLRSIAVQSKYCLAYRSLEKLCNLCKTFDVRIELGRLQAWGDAFDFHASLLDILGKEDEALLYNDLIFGTILKSLHAMSELTYRYLELDTSTTPIHFDLRTINDALYGQLNPNQQERSRRCLESQLLSSSEDPGQFEIPWLPYVDKSLINAMKQMHALMAEDAVAPKRDRGISREALRDWKPFQAAFQAIYYPGSGQRDVSVFIEWVVYGVHWTDEVGVKLFKRIGSLADVLSSPVSVSRLRVLPCRGYFHAPERQAFGLVYELPTPTIQSRLEPSEIFSLRDLIQSTQDVRQRPFLGQLFELAYRLAEALFNIHKAGWLHKALTPSNIIFSIPCAKRTSFNLAGEFRIVGFNHSRPDNPTEYTEAVWKRSAESCLYQHPRYLQNKERFRIEHDYYSFGLILLELGMWKHLVSLATPKQSPSDSISLATSSKNLSKYLLESKVPLLGPKMGKRYRDIVAFCLNMDIHSQVQPSQHGSNNQPEAVRTTQLRFERNVLRVLGQLEV